MSVDEDEASIRKPVAALEDCGASIDRFVDEKRYLAPASTDRLHFFALSPRRDLAITTGSVRRVGFVRGMRRVRLMAPSGQLDLAPHLVEQQLCFRCVRRLGARLANRCRQIADARRGG
jgi:hypothetical protein